MSGSRVAQTVSQLGYGLDVVQLPVGVRDCSLIQSVPSGSVAHSASCSVGTGVSFLRG